MTVKVRAPVVGLREGVMCLGPEASRYLARVLRMADGDAFVAFDPRAAAEADAVILGVERGGVRVRVGPLLEGKVVASRAITWVQGLAKGEKMDAIVRDATELGATQIVAARSRFSVLKLNGSSAQAKLLRWQRIADEAARQCRRSDAPRVLGPLDWDEALAVAPAHAQRFCLYERAGVPLGGSLAAAVSSEGQALAFAAGPEGGLGEDEVKRAEQLGWASVSLGRFILRTETVAAAVLGAALVLDRGQK